MWTLDQQIEAITKIDLHPQGAWLKVVMALRIRFGFKPKDVLHLKWHEIEMKLGRKDVAEAWWWRSLDRWYAELSVNGEQTPGAWPWVCRQWYRGIWRVGTLKTVTAADEEVRAILQSCEGLGGLTRKQLGKWHEEWKDPRRIRQLVWAKGRKTEVGKKLIELTIQKVKELRGEVKHDDRWAGSKGVDWSKVRQWWHERYSKSQHGANCKPWKELEPGHMDEQRKALAKLKEKKGKWMERSKANAKAKREEERRKNPKPKHVWTNVGGRFVKWESTKASRGEVDPMKGKRPRGRPRKRELGW